MRALLCLLWLQACVAAAAAPVTLHYPTAPNVCTVSSLCPVAVLSPGYGFGGEDYGFITRQLNEMGYLVAAFGPEIPGGIKLDPTRDRRVQILALARHGADRIRDTLAEIETGQTRYSWQRVLLVGHSLGGDSSALFASENPSRVSALITLDNRRIALPRSAQFGVLSIRASDTVADPGVLPDEDELKTSGICLVTIAESRHDAMHDGGGAQLKTVIGRAIGQFLAAEGARKLTCNSHVHPD